MSRARDIVLSLVVLAALVLLAPSVLGRVDTDLRDAVGGAQRVTGPAATFSGWKEVPTAYPLSGMLGSEGVGVLVAVGRQGDRPCLLEMVSGAGLRCRTLLDTEGAVSALAGDAEWLLAASASSGSEPRAWTADGSYVRGPDEDAAQANPLPADGVLPRGSRLMAAAIDDDSFFPIVAGTTPVGATQRLQVWAVTDTMRAIASPGGPQCCEVRPGSSVVASGTDPDVLVAAEVRSSSSTEPFTVRAWTGSADDSTPDARWDWQQLPLPTRLDRVTDARGQTLDHWLAGSTNGQPVVITTKSATKGIAEVSLPAEPLDPGHPVVLLARTSFLDDGLVLAVQTARGPQVWVRPDKGSWSSAPLPPGTIVDAETVGDTTYVTIRGTHGVHLWSKRLAASTSRTG